MLFLNSAASNTPHWPCTYTRMCKNTQTRGPAVGSRDGYMEAETEGKFSTHKPRHTFRLSAEYLCAEVSQGLSPVKTGSHAPIHTQTRGYGLFWGAPSAVVVLREGAHQDAHAGMCFALHGGVGAVEQTLWGPLRAKSHNVTTGGWAH